MPIGPGGLDPNGIWQYGEDDSEALASDLLNLGMSSVSTAIGSLPSPADPAILQVLQTVKTDAFATTVNSDITGLSVSITPSSATSKILVMANIACSKDDAGTVTRSNAVTIFRGATNLSQPTTAVTDPVGDGFGAQSQVRSEHAIPVIAINFLDSPATTSPVTYQAYTYTNSGAGPFRVNQNENNQYWRAVSTITVMEVAG